MDIQVFITDVDGTLTDGKYHVSSTLADGQYRVTGGTTKFSKRPMHDISIVSKSFFTRDFYAMGELIKNNIKVIAATSSKSGIIYQKAMSLSYIINLIGGVEDKKEAIEDFLAAWNLTWDNVAYIGDAENDIECIKAANLSCCPKDAIPDVKNIVDIESKYNGGNGAVWEFANYVLKLQKK